MAVTVEEAREILRADVKRSSLSAVAERIGINRSTLATFVREGGVERPIGRVLEPILAYAERRLVSARTLEESSSPVQAESGLSDYGRGMLRAMRAMHLTLASLHEELESREGVAVSGATSAPLPPLPLQPLHSDVEDQRKRGA